MYTPLEGNIYLVYKRYILSLGWWYAAYHLFLQESEKCVDFSLTSMVKRSTGQPFNKVYGQNSNQNKDPLGSRYTPLKNSWLKKTKTYVNSIINMSTGLYIDVWNPETFFPRPNRFGFHLSSGQQLTKDMNHEILVGIHHHFSMAYRNYLPPRKKIWVVSRPKPKPPTTGVIILSTQTMNIIMELPPNYHKLPCICII